MATPGPPAAGWNRSHNHISSCPNRIYVDVQIDMTWFIGLGIVLCAWGFLTVLGSERTRLIQKMQQDWRREQILAAKQAADASK